MSYDPSRSTLPFTENNSSDIALSHWEYHDFIDQMIDDRISAEGLMKFKRLHSAMAFNALAIPLVTFPIAYVASKWLVGTPFSRQGSSTGAWGPPAIAF